ncbi:sensor domain-containing protein [Terrabacter sp. 2YAF2]|uniref:sensor histidine kinase n=1 Tax=Terrabacter sp. 2YAF2 TaxID=3233026 RepID=UPI003F96F171
MTPNRRRLERRLAPRHTAYVVLGGVVAAVAAPFVWALAGLATGLAVLVVGVAVVGLLLVVSEGLSRWHRARAAALLGVAVAAPAGPAAPGWRGWLARLGRATTWRQLAYHALVAPVVLSASAALLAFCWGGGLVLVTSPLWSRISPEVAALSGGVLQGVGRIWAQTAVGFGCLVIAPRLARGLAALDLAILRPMLGETRGEQLSPRVTALEQTRAGVIDAADAERRRIERDLHDGAQQRLTSLALNLGMARSALTTDAPPATRRAIEDAHDEAKQALAELRGFVRGLHPAVLDERGLDAALSGIVARSPVPTSLHVLLAHRPPRTLEAVAYFVVSEALTNIARHSGATSATVRVTSDARSLVVEVSDNGHGGAATGSGSGLTGLTNRVASVDGTLTVTSPVGGPTVLRAEMPCAS